MAADDNTQRKKPLFTRMAATAATGATGATRVRSIAAGFGGGAASAPAKPAAFAFSMKKPPPAKSDASAASSSVKTAAATKSKSGALGGALRVPVFGKRAVGATSMAATTKAPFAMSMGVKAVVGKARATTALPIQRNASLSFRTLSSKKTADAQTEKKSKADETKVEQKSIALPTEKAPPATTPKPAATGGKAAAPALTFSRVKVALTQQNTKFQARPSVTSAKTSDTKGSRFQFTPTRIVEKPSPAVSSSASRVPIAASASVANADALDVGIASKKRLQAQATQNVSTPAKKLRMETSGSVSSKTLQDLNVVSPEPRAPARTLTTRVLADTEEVITSEIDRQGAFTVNGPSDTRDAFEEPVRSIDPLHALGNIVELQGSVSSALTAASGGVFVTAEEEELASRSIDSGGLDDESANFLERVRDLQLFIDDVDEQRQRTCNELLDSSAIASECLLDIVHDLTAVKGGVKLMELDKLSSTAQLQFDSQAQHSSDVAFPW